MVIFPYHIKICFAVFTGVLLLAEQLGGAVEPFKADPAPVPPAVFNNVGSSVEEWEKYLRKISDDLDDQTSSSGITTTAEDKLFSQVNSFETHKHLYSSAWFVQQGMLKKYFKNI